MKTFLQKKKLIIPSSAYQQEAQICIIKKMKVINADSKVKQIPWVLTHKIYHSWLKHGAQLLLYNTSCITMGMASL